MFPRPIHFPSFPKLGSHRPKKSQKRFINYTFCGRHTTGIYYRVSLNCPLCTEENAHAIITKTFREFKAKCICSKLAGD